MSVKIQDSTSNIDVEDGALLVFNLSSTASMVNIVNLKIEDSISNVMVEDGALRIRTDGE